MGAKGPVTVIAAGAFAVALTGTGFAVGTAVAPKPLKACATKVNVLTLLSSKGKCAKGSHVVSFAVKGPQGETGAKGDTGAKGATGTTGATGPSDGYIDTNSPASQQSIDNGGLGISVASLNDLPAGSYMFSWAVDVTTSGAFNSAITCFLVYTDPTGASKTTGNENQVVPASTFASMAGTTALAVGAGTVHLHCNGGGLVIPAGLPQTLTAVRVATLHVNGT